MKKIRGFEIAKGFEKEGINLPERKTKNSAGYDIEAAEDCIVPAFKPGQAPTLVKTGLKAYFNEDEALFLATKSSYPGKKGLLLANSIGVIESDYYENQDNDGHIMFAYYNLFPTDVTIKKHEAAGQAFFQKFLITDNDNATGIRTGDWGSTSK